MEASHHVYTHLSDFRSEDKYHPDMSCDEIIDTYFPPTITALVTSLSGITSAFYGVMLKNAGLLKGKHFIDALSQATIGGLGKFRVAAAVQANPELQRDARGVLLVFLSAIFTSSPEYRFNVVEFKPEIVKLIITGTDRYHRIARLLNMADDITWPSITPFIQSVCDELAPGYKADVTLIELAADSSACVYEVLIHQKISGEETEEIQSTGMSAPFSKLPPGKKQGYGHLLHAELGNTDDFMANGFTELIRYCISLEAWNFSRLYRPIGKYYMVGEKFRAYKYDEIKSGTTFSAVIESAVAGKQKRKSIVSIISDTGEQVYNMLFDYYMLEEEKFRTKFPELKAPEVPAAAHSEESLPQITRTSFENPYQYQAILSPFTHTHCSGHFTDYPCVPILLIFKCLAVEAEKWLQDIVKLPVLQRPVVDSTECFPVKMMPVDTPAAVNISVIRLSKKRFKFVGHIVSLTDPAIVYSVVIIDFDLPVIV